MAINPVQMNIKSNVNFLQNGKKEHKYYLEAEGAVSTKDNVHPLPPQGHLIHDNFSNSIKYYFKDRAYDYKSLKNGIKGTANDHQSGRLNDIGLVAAGIMIATYLASKTKNPHARIMEYVGLGTFLTAMAIYPKIAINTPSKLMHGYDFDKEFIDDQGRKKSVMQDSNYVPYDMYRGEIPEEDLALIGDKMGIPRDIKNRNDVIREQMRKNATQSNTLWMLTAGVTPALTALMCCGIENYIVAPALEKANIAKYDSAIKDALEKTKSMSLDVESLSANQLSSKVEKLLNSYKGQELPKEEFENLYRILSEDLFENTAEGIKEDITKILRTSAEDGKEAVVIADDTIKTMLKSARDSVSVNNHNLQKTLVPTNEEMKSILERFVSKNSEISKGTTLAADKIVDVKQAVKELIDSKISGISNVPKEFLESQRNEIVESISKSLVVNKSTFVSEEGMNKIVNLAKVLGDFKANQKVISKCKEFNVEYTNGTVIARSYSKFEKTLLDVLGIKYGDLKKMRESEKFTKEILDEKFKELCKDEARYEKAMEKLGNVVSEMEVKLHGPDESGSRILDIINATENNYNNTAKRLSKVGSFEETINRLVKEDVKTLSNKINTREEVFDLLDGILENKFDKVLDDKGWYNKEVTAEQRLKYMKSRAAGIGSSKNLEISRMIERYQGAKNSFNRIMHTMDLYMRAKNPETFSETLKGKSRKQIDTIIKEVLSASLYASASDHTMKLHTINNPNLYKNIMGSGWEGLDNETNFYTTKQKGKISSATERALNKTKGSAKGNVLDRFQYYITRFRNIVGNNNIDFTKPEHILNNKIRKYYTEASRTRMSIFNLIAQTPVDMAKGAAGRRFATQKWVRIISAITGSIFGVALLAQLGFGKLNNPQNLQKKVGN